MPFRAWLEYFLANSEIPYYQGLARGKFLRANEIEYPFIKKSEPGKRITFLTDDGERDAKSIAARFHYTSLHVDRFFMQVRRSIAGLERARSTPGGRRGSGTCTASIRRRWSRRC